MNRKTIARKLEFLAAQSKLHSLIENMLLPKAQTIEFDDLETFELSRMKPLSVTLAVEHKTRRILGFKVSQMPCKGRLTKLSIKKYGPRKDERSQGRAELFKELQPLVNQFCEIKSDQNPHYPSDVKKYFPDALHLAYEGQRGSTTGQGELKRVRFDPIFSLNHTCAMFRANINRLFRKTWCTTKNKQALEDHIALYCHYHNQVLIPPIKI